MLQRQKDIRRLQRGGGGGAAETEGPQWTRGLQRQRDVRGPGDCRDRRTSEDQGAAETVGHKTAEGGGGAAETEGRQRTRGLQRQRDVRGPGGCRDSRT